MGDRSSRGPKFTRQVPRFLQQYSHLLNVNKKNYMNEDIGGYNSSEEQLPELVAAELPMSSVPNTAERKDEQLPKKKLKTSHENENMKPDLANEVTSSMKETTSSIDDENITSGRIKFRPIKPVKDKGGNEPKVLKRSYPTHSANERSKKLLSFVHDDSDNDDDDE